MNSGRVDIWWLSKFFTLVFYPTYENVRDKAAPWGEILSHLTRPKDERGYDLSETGAPDIFFREAADGFCSWFILQYMRGYKPFVTMMSKEIIIERYSDGKNY